MHVCELDELCSDLKCTEDDVVLSPAVAHADTVRRGLSVPEQRCSLGNGESSSPARTLQPLICFSLCQRVAVDFYLFIWCDRAEDNCWATQFRGGRGNGLPGNGLREIFIEGH